MTNIFNAFMAKPVVGVGGGLGGTVAWVATWCGILTPVFGFLAAILGSFAAGYHLLVLWKRWEEMKRIEALYCRMAHQCPHKVPFVEE